MPTVLYLLELKALNDALDGVGAVTAVMAPLPSALKVISVRSTLVLLLPIASLLLLNDSFGTLESLLFVSDQNWLNSNVCLR